MPLLRLLLGLLILLVLLVPLLELPLYAALVLRGACRQPGGARPLSKDSPGFTECKPALHQVKCCTELPTNISASVRHGSGKAGGGGDGECLLLQQECDEAGGAQAVRLQRPVWLQGEAWSVSGDRWRRLDA